MSLAYLENLGRTPYQTALAEMTELAAARNQWAVPDTVMLLEHEPVITLGSRADRGAELPLAAEEYERRGIEIVEVPRGGRSTYHGPGQLVCYPILDLTSRDRDLRGYVRGLEQVIIRTLAGYGVEGATREGAHASGVWVGERKIASIGVRCAGWVASHGFSLNADLDLEVYRLFDACGLGGAEFTSLSAETGAPGDRRRVCASRWRASWPPSTASSSRSCPVPWSELTRERPSWIKVRAPSGNTRFNELQDIMREGGLHTVCEEARCPNIGECWGRGTATFQIMGEVCTRACRYCAVTSGRPPELPDPFEPTKVASAVKRMQLGHVVVTSVDRDDLPDRGAGHFAATIRAIRRARPECGIEVLVPDFLGFREEALRTVLEAAPDVFNHNIETAEPFYRRVRPKGDYQKALDLLDRAKDVWSDLFPDRAPIVTKSGIIVGMGESDAEVVGIMRDLRAHRVDVVTIGQYLQPTEKHLPLDRWVTPAQFDALRDEGMAMGFGAVFAGPLVRSSYRAEEQRLAAETGLPVTV